MVWLLPMRKTKVVSGGLLKGLIDDLPLTGPPVDNGDRYGADK